MKLELAILAIMVTLVGFVITYAFNTRRALKDAVKAEVPAVLGNLAADFDHRFSSYEEKVAVSSRQAYVSAMQAIQAFFACANAGVTAMDRATFKVSWEHLMVTGSLLQVQFGDSTEAITGANNLYHLAPPGAARAALAARLKRQDMNAEATATLQSRLRELEKRGEAIASRST
ncbi:MAG TPA: hypothetical protein PKN00_22145 [Sedimentisphaerales bacterium]|nr:hypothetical protein [Sedimentisphaerales bacterium]